MAVDIETDVLVVGAGPAGLVAGIALARYGARVLVVEKRRTTSNLSRALVISTRTMEVLRSWRLEEEIRAGAADVEPKLWLAESLAADEGKEVSLGFPSVVEAALISPSRPAWAPQDHLEPLLRRLLEAQPTAQMRFACELVGLS
jgi:putative polyketide hydroxylase